MTLLPRARATRVPSPSVLASIRFSSPPSAHLAHLAGQAYPSPLLLQVAETVAVVSLADSILTTRKDTAALAWPPTYHGTDRASPLLSNCSQASKPYGTLGCACGQNKTKTKHGRT